MMVLSSLLRRVAISAGILAGPNSAAKNSTLIGGMPASTVVGTSGRRGERVGVVTARARSLPSLMCDRVTVGVAKTAWMVPPRTSVTAGPPPLVGKATHPTVGVVPAVAFAASGAPAEARHVVLVPV